MRDHQATVRQICKIIDQHERFLVVSHANPDGDALGSAAAVGYLLQALGKSVRLYNATGAPASLAWLPLPAPLHASLDELADFAPSWHIVLDCGDIDRVDPDYAARADKNIIINIDHHLGNPGFGAVNWVDPSRAAVGCMAADLAHAFNIPLAGPLGEAIYLAIVSDTGNFSYGNTSPRVLELAAEILRLGLDVGAFNARLWNTWTLARLRLWSVVLAQTRLHCHGAVGVAAVTRRMLQETGATREDCEGLVETVRRVKGVRMAIALREEEGGMVRVSLRSTGLDNVQELAARFGGGGHRNASGATFCGTVDEAELALATTATELLGMAPHCPELQLGPAHPEPAKSGRETA